MVSSATSHVTGIRGRGYPTDISCESDSGEVGETSSSSTMTIGDVEADKQGAQYCDQLPLYPSLTKLRHSAAARTKTKNTVAIDSDGSRMQSFSAIDDM